MARKAQRDAVLPVLKHSSAPLPAVEILRRAGPDLPPRTLRRWLSEWVNEGLITRSGVGRATRYQSVATAGDESVPAPSPLGFLRGLDGDLKRELLAQIRDLWTHTSTALEGNTLTLGDTHFVLQEGLTISGKPIKDHQEVIGHARAIDLLYRCLNEPLTESIVFELHKAVQTDQVTDIHKRNGAWKVDPNGTHMVAADGRLMQLEWVNEGLITRSGVGRATRYQSVATAGDESVPAPSPLGFLRGLDGDLKRELLAQIRDLWTHTSRICSSSSFTFGPEMILRCLWRITNMAG